MDCNISQYEMKCCGCGLCASICPKQSITMKADAYGFRYPSVDESRCVHCGVCVKKCQFNHELIKKAVSKAYLSKAKDTEILKQSTSGGMYTSISDVIFNRGGVIYAPDFDREMNLRHIRMTEKVQRNHSCGSKYVQSNIEDVLEQIKADLLVREVAFFGTPCQVEALLQYVPEKLQEKLLTVDVICNGVGSPMVWKQHVERLEKRFHKRMTKYVFRSKVDGYLSTAEIACFSDGTQKVIDNMMWKFNPTYYSGKILRPSCSMCKYTSENRVSDITIGDFSRVKEKYPDFHASWGASTLMINSAKGYAILESMKDSIDYLPINDLSDHERLKNSEHKNQHSSAFLQGCLQNGMNEMIRRQSTGIQRMKITIASLQKKCRRASRRETAYGEKA